jgi:hypothetical protein
MLSAADGAALERVLRYSTSVGWAIIVLAGLLAAAGVPMFILVRGRKAVMAFLLFSILPLMLGLCGTVIGFRAAFAAMADAGIPASSRELAEAHRHALSTTYMGIIASGLLWAIGLLALALKRPEPVRPPAP